MRLGPFIFIGLQAALLFGCASGAKALTKNQAGNLVVPIDELAAFDQTGTNVYQYYHPDDLTSTSIQTDQNGNQVQNYEYSAFGQSRYTQDTNLFKVSRRYTGQVLDDNTGLYYCNARYYGPVQGRFTQPDDVIPDLFNPQTYNRYAYCVNNPLRFTDPSGHDPAFTPGMSMFEGLSVQERVAASRVGAPFAVGMGVAMATGGAATPLLVSAGASATFAAVGSGLIAGAAGDLASQGTQIGLGTRSSISGQEVAVNGLGGAALGYVGGKLLSIKGVPEPANGGIKPVLKGQAGVAKSEAAAIARGETIRGKEVTFELPGGSRTRADLVTESQQDLKIVESKNGPTAQLTSRQAAAQAAVQQGQSLVPRGANAQNAGLPPLENLSK